MGKKKSKQKRQKQKKHIKARKRRTRGIQPLMIYKTKHEELEFIPFKRMSFIPAFLAVPKFIMDQAPKPIRDIPRTKRGLLFSKESRSFFESDLFILFFSDVYAYMAWQYMKPGEYMEVYSGYDPAWLIAHSASTWINAATELGFFPTFEKWFRLAPWEGEFQYMTLDLISFTMSTTVKYVLEVYHIGEILKVVDEHRCFEDYDYRESKQKTDFFRDWYHMRTKHPTVSLDDYMEDYRESHNGQEWDVIDESPGFESDIETKDLADRFMATLSEKDRRILELRLQEWTMEEIAEKLGYKNHTGVLKRLRKIGQAFEEYADVDYDFEGHRII